MDADTALRWSQYSQHRHALSALLYLYSLSRCSRDEGGQGWTEPVTKTDILKACGISRSYQSTVFSIIEHEFDAGARSGYEISWRFKGFARSKFDHTADNAASGRSNSDHTERSNLDHISSSGDDTRSNLDHMDESPPPLESDETAAPFDDERSDLDHTSGNGAVIRSNSDHTCSKRSNLDHTADFIPANVFKDSNTQPSDQDDQQTDSESGNQVPIAETETTERPCWTMVSVEEIKRMFQDAEITRVELREILALEEDMPLRPEGVSTRTRSDGVPYQRASLIDWLRGKLDDREKVTPEDFELAKVIGQYSLKTPKTAFDPKLENGPLAMRITKALIQISPRPTPEMLTSAYAWYHEHKIAEPKRHGRMPLDWPASEGAILRMYRGYMTWKAEEQGLYPCVHCGELQGYGEFELCAACRDDESIAVDYDTASRSRFTSGKYADIIES